MKKIALLLILLPQISQAACDCGSTDIKNPCTGTSISVTVNSTRPPGINSTFSWKFNSGGGDAACGKFANGDYWVAPAAGQEDVTITDISSTTNLITVDANPHAGNVGLLNGFKKYSGYNSSENIIPNLPISYSSNISLVAAIQRDEPTTSNCGTSLIIGECVDSYNILTVLGTIPVNAGSDMIRPNATGETKELLTLSDFDLTRIPRKDFLTGSNSSGLEIIRQRWSHSIESLGVNWSIDGGKTYFTSSEGGRAYRSHILADDYAAGRSKQLHDDLAVLFSDDNTTNEKIPAIAALLSYGLDLYHAIFSAPAGYNVKWGSGAGQHLGKITPVVFLASLEVDNPERLSAIKSIATESNFFQPQELAQVHVGPNGPVWGDMDTTTRYWTDLVKSKCYDNAPGTCDPNIGQKTAADPQKYIDGPANKPGSAYFGIGYAGIFNFSAITLMMPELYNVVNTSKSIDFVNRARIHGLQTLPDPCVTPDLREDFSICSVWTGGVNCKYYYPTASIARTWGPIDLVDASKGCVETETPGFTQAGRFASLDGSPAPITMGYVSSQLFNNWETIYTSSKALSLPLENVPQPQLFRFQ